MKKGVKFLIFFILIALIWIIFLLLFKSRITGYSINAKNFYLVGENLEGFYNLKLRQGELWPLDAKVVVKANNITKELSLRDWLEQSGIDYEIIYGNFYVYDKNIYGYGEGFGKIGKYIEKPNIKFEIKIYSKEKEEHPVEEEHQVEIKPEIPVEQPTPIEQPQETVEQPQEEIPSQTEQPTEVEQPVEQPQLPPEEAETPAVPEQPSEQPEKPEAEKVQEGIFSRLIKYGPLNFFYLFRNLVGFAITNEIEGEKIIQAYVNIDNPYILEINENQYAEFVSGSVKINDIPADDKFIKFEKKDNKIIVTTDYKIEREGFGKEFLGEEFYINLSLNIFNLTFDKEGFYDLDVEIIYNNIILDKASAKIFVEKSNQTYYIIKLIDEKGRVIKEINISKNETREGIKLKIKEEKIILEKPEEIKVLSLIPFVKAQLPTSRLPVCGNNECESGEDTSNCPSDCPFTIYNYRGGDISVQFISPSQELINKGILTEIVYSTPADFDYALIKLNKIDPSLEISKILKCENWNAINTSCVGNFIPVDIPFVDYGDYIVINITNFSAYAGGAGYNASLVIWDSSDARAIGIKETIFFYANYSTYPDGIPINDSNGICLAFFSFENRPGFFSEMQFNYSSMLWETSFLTTEDMVGINNFTVNCSSSNYDNLTASDEFIIQNISVNIITNCTEINQSGIYKLNSNLTATLSSSFDGACIKIASDNVIFDCNNYAIINDLTDPTPYIITILKRTPSGLETGYNVSIKNCEIYNVYGNGIEINTFNNVNLENIKILKQERDYCWSLEVCGGIDIYDSNNISINNYYYEGSGIFGLRISNSSYLIARNIDIINHGYEVVTGECIYANMLNNSIFDEGFLNCSINLRLNGGSNINISNFYITNSYVRVTGGNIIIENNTFEDIYSFGAIDFLDSENIFIRNNIFKNVKGEYIKVDSSNNFEIYNNTFYYNSSEGLSNIIYSSASNNGIIKDNKFIYDDFTDYSQPLNNSSFIGISNSNNEIIKFENNYFKWEENEFYFDALIINTTSIYAYKGSPPSSPNNLIPLNKSLIIYQYSYNNRIDLNISFDPIYSNISYYKIDLLNDSGWIQQYTEIINNKAYTYFETPALNETYVFLSLFGEAPAECTCNSCKDCMDKLNDPSCTEVKLINDIINHTGTCINNPSNFSNKVFDCQGYRIDGDDSGTDYGIYLNGKQNNTIKNCVITDFQFGIYLYSSSNNILTNNTASSNYDGISLSSSSNNILTNNTASSNNRYGIHLWTLSNNNTLTNNNVSSNDYGIYLYSSSNNILTNNTASSNNRYGIRLDYSSSRNTLTNNTANSNIYGIYLEHSSNNTLTNNTANSNIYGIYLYYSSNNTLTNNTANSNIYGGIYLWISSNSILINNTMNNNTYNFGIYGQNILDYYQDIDTSNTVDGKPIYYWTNEKNAPNNCKNAEIDESSNAGFVALVGCDNITVKNLNLSNNFRGILLVNTTNSTLTNNTIRSNNIGIYLNSSSNNILTNNNASSNNVDGIYLGSSSNNNLTNNIASSNNRGIYLYSSSNNTMTNNIASSNSWGIYLDSSSSNNLTNNIASSNYDGISLFSSSNNILTNNTASSNNRYGIHLWTLSNNNTLTNNNVSSNDYGIYLYSSSNNILTNNTASSNSRGIYLYYSSNNNTLTNNNVSSNYYIGIYLYSSSNNKIYNNFFNNTNNFGFGGTIYANNWNTTKQAGTNIVGGPYIGGNYWAKPDGTGFSETCTDANEDGICDNPYTLNSDNVDYLPLSLSCLCNSCSSCTNKLNNAYCTEVRLTADIINHTGTCINNPSNFNNKIFDCQGYRIDGDDSVFNYGIYLNSKQNNTIKNCIITDFYYGIYLWDSSNNTLTNNTVSSNYYGIYLWDSSNNILRNNNLIKNTYNFNIYRTILENYYHDIDTSNKVDGRPILYLTNKTSSCENIIIDKNYPGGEPGFVGLVGCNNITVKDLDLYNNRYGIMLVATSNSFIYNNSVHNNIDGIWLHLASNNNTISNNIVFYQDSYGIRIGGHETQEIGCNNTIIENNTVFDNDIGITPRFGKNYNLTIRNNNVSNNNGLNILIRSIDNVKIENNIIENRNCLFLADFGLSTGNITNVIILNNKLSGCWNGIYLGTENNQDYIINVSIINNSITNGTNGIYVSSDRIINPQLLSNYICFNDNYDIINYNDLTGNNNTCDKTYNYNDIDKEEGCTYPCPIAVECTCNSCEDCTNKLNNENCTKVKLINDIINIDRNPCINISFSNKIFDCQNHSIIGNETTLIDYVAILINPASNVTIKNCNIERFYNAILLGIGSRSPKNYNFINIINNTLLNNSMAITYSEKIEIYNSQIENNTLIDNIFGIKFKGSNNIIRNNKIRGRYMSNFTSPIQTIGIMIYHPSTSTLIDNNIVCKHVYDIKADTYASGIQNYCDVAINFSDSNASGCKKKTDINFDIKSYLLKSDKIPIIKFDVILYSNISAKARLYSKYNWKEEWKPNFGASSCILLLGGSLQRSSEKLTLQESTSKESIITFKLIQESVGEESISLSPLEQKPSLPPPEPLPPKPPYKPPIFTLCSSSGELVSVYSGDEIFAEGYGIVSPTEPCMEGRESYNITFLDAFPYKDCNNNTIMEFEYYKIEFENFCNKKESDVYLRKTNELIKSPSKQTGINFVSFTTDIRYGGIAVASDGKMAIVTPEDIDCTIQLPIELKAVSPWITLSSSSELLTSCISRKLQEENSSARLIYASYWDEERQMYVGHPASLFANAYIKDFPIKLGKSYFVDVNKNLTFTQFGKLPPESIWHEIKAIGEKINIITLTPHQQNITTVRQLCNLSFINPYRYVEYWDPINQDFLQVESQRCMFSSNTALDLSIPYRVSVIENYSGYIP